MVNFATTIMDEGKINITEVSNDFIELGFC